MYTAKITELLKNYKEVISKPNKVSTKFYNGVYDRWENPVLTRDHIPVFWKYDMNPETNPYSMERLGVNATFNSGAVPIKTEKGWIHIAHGVRNTAAGLRYVIYVFATDLQDPAKLIAEPSGFFIAPLGEERVGDVSNVVFTNGAIVNEKNEVFIYYASDDTRLHVATTTIDKLVDYTFNTPSDPLRSPDCVKQRCDFIAKNLEFMGK